ncbi:MAG: hypothetical protein DME86_11760 [Verrucomicrobia bacterium]|nr:MAG: hypothetical protein DME86_11760 [Verrucomicrobiota bacterium]
MYSQSRTLAEQIVSQLKSKLSPQEKAAIEQKPTADLAAHDLYIRAKILIETAVFSTPLQESLFEAVRLLNQAIERDPAFALAYYQLAYAQDVIYFTGADHTPARLAMADAAIQSLSRLRPDSGEAHLALAKHLYWGYLDYDRARQELNLAKESLPNEPLRFRILGYIDRRQGRWVESTKNLERAAEFDLFSNNSVITICVCAIMPMPSAFWTTRSRLLPKTQRCERFVRRSSFAGMLIRTR